MEYFLRANKKQEAGELRRENLTGSIRTWQLPVIWSGSEQNILVLLLCIFIKMIFPFQLLHMPVYGSKHSIHWLSIHMVCIQWHHTLLYLPSRTSLIDHQNTVSQSLWGLGSSSKATGRSYRMEKLLMFYPIYSIPSLIP